MGISSHGTYVSKAICQQLVTFNRNSIRSIFFLETLKDDRFYTRLKITELYVDIPQRKIRWSRRTPVIYN